MKLFDDICVWNKHVIILKIQDPRIVFALSSDCWKGHF